jgi:hypothetical protein
MVPPMQVESGGSSVLLRALRIALLGFVVIVGATAVVAYITREPEPLPLEYEGYD